MAKFIPSRRPKRVLAAPKDSADVPTKKSRFSFLKWVDPFTYVDLWVMPRVKRITESSIVEFLVNAGFALFFAWIIYSALGLAFGTSSPLVIVYSASMEPTFFRGDVMVLSKAVSSDNYGAPVVLDRNISGVPVFDYATTRYSAAAIESVYFKDLGQAVAPVKSGNVVVYDSYPAHLPIIHRAVMEIQALDGNFILTKGDNQLTNPTFDEDCGAIVGGLSQKPCISFYAVPVSSLQGKAFFTIPKIGCVKLWLFDDLASLIQNGSLPPDFRGIC